MIFDLGFIVSHHAGCRISLHADIHTILFSTTTPEKGRERHTVHYENECKGLNKVVCLYVNVK